VRELVGVEPALLRQLLRRLAKRRLGLRRAFGERFGVGGIGQGGKPRLRLGEQRGQRFGPHAMLARHVVDGGQALLHTPELGGSRSSLRW
jgi:hypothetical protein